MDSDVFTNLINISNNLVTGYNWKVGWWRATLDFIQFGMADTAGMNPDQYLRILWSGRGDDIVLQRGG